MIAVNVRHQDQGRFGHTLEPSGAANRIHVDHTIAPLERKRGVLDRIEHQFAGRSRNPFAGDFRSA